MYLDPLRVEDSGGGLVETWGKLYAFQKGKLCVLLSSGSRPVI